MFFVLNLTMKRITLLGFLFALATFAFTVGASHDDRPPKKAGYTVENHFKSDIFAPVALNANTFTVTNLTSYSLPESGRLCTLAEVKTKTESAEKPATILFEIRPHSTMAFTGYKICTAGHWRPPQLNMIVRSVLPNCRTANC